MVACGFAYWVLATPSGSRWALKTGASQVDARLTGISGTVWRGLRIDEADVPLPDAGRVQVKDLQLQADWHELLSRRLHVINLSAATVEVDLPHAAQDAQPSEPFHMPTLPISLAVDRLAVDKIVLRQEGKPIPVDVGKVDTSVYLDNQGGQVSLRSLTVGNAQLNALLAGELRLTSLEDPWPLQLSLTTTATGLTPSSPLCARNYLATLPAGKDAGDCTLTLDTQVQGNLDQLKLALTGSGQGMSADAHATITPRAVFPLKDADVNLTLADGSSVKSTVDWQSERVGDNVRDRLVGKLNTENLNVGQLVGEIIPAAVLSVAADFDLHLLNRSVVESADLSLVFGKGSSWNKNLLSGHLKTRIQNNAPASAGKKSSVNEQTATGAKAPIVPALLKNLALAAIDMDLTLGPDHLKAAGALGATDSKLTLDLKSPKLSAFWPALAGGASLKGDLAGTLAQHKTDLIAQYTPEHAVAGKVGEAAIDAHVVLDGGWGHGPDGKLPEGWRGTIRSVNGDHAGFTLKIGGPTSVSFVPDATAPAWQWEVGRSQLELLMDSRPLVSISHTGSRGGPGRWETVGTVPKVLVSPGRIESLRKKLGMATVEAEKHGGVKVRGDVSTKDTEIALGLDWNLKFAGVLEGAAHVKYLSGDIIVPAEPPFPLALRTMTLDLQAKRANAAASNLTATLNVVTKDMGRLTAEGGTLLHAKEGRLYLEPKDRKTVKLDADIDDLGWLSLFTGDAMEFGGALKANLDVQSGADGSWNSNGSITGSKLRIVRIDDGIRLLDGTLTAHVAQNKLILDKLSFPARLRATPKEWRTQEWVSKNPDAQGGSLTLSGEWDIFKSLGVVDLNFYRYPLLQRADRYAMISGKVRLTAELPKIAITGSVVADAGWFDLDMLGGIPTVDSDVVVLRAGEDTKQVNVPLDLSLDLDVDLGKRFYLTGYGVNSGLVGKLHIAMIANKLTAIGALQTRGGAIETYGQRLQLRRGTLTFQGDIASPVLDIEALRTGLAVEAGVRVAGTGKRPRIDLISYPAVSEIEKLSWLLLGHGPDDSGGDVALLFSVGTSFLGNGEPFYRKFGIDEVSMRSGELGGAGSILPAESVVKGLDDSDSNIEKRFIIVSKSLANGVTLSLRQALSDTGTVGHASYKLARDLTAELSVGTVSGLALVYRWFSRDRPSADAKPSR